jgi:hypothetical protein
VKQCFVEKEGLPRLSRSEVPLVVVANAGEMSVGTLGQLERYVRDGGKLLVFAGERMPSTQAEALTKTELAPGKLARAEKSSVMPFRIASISEGGSMLEPFRDPQHGDLSRLAFRSLIRADIAEPSRVLASFDSQRPAITQHALGQGRIAWFMSSADNRSGNWTVSPLYLPLVRQMAADLLDLTGEGPIRFRDIGDSLDADTSRALKTTAAQGSAALDQSNKRVTFDQPGFVRAGGALFVVNTLPKESDLARIDPKEFATRCGITLAAEDAEKAAKVESQGRYELWPWLSAALIILLVAEFSLANRTPA